MRTRENRSWTSAVVRRAAILAAMVAVASCSGESSNPQGPSAAPTPTPAPTPAGTIRLVGASLPSGSTVKVMPMFVLGQQAPELSFAAGIMVRQDLKPGLVRAWVRTAAQRCMGGGLIADFQANVERGVAPASLSHPGHGMPICALPYTTTEVEFEVIGNDAEQPLLVQRFPAVYHFVQ